jgi:hypothetical protein
MCKYIIIIIIIIIIITIITIIYIRTNGAFYFQKCVHGKLNKILIQPISVSRFSV